MSGAQETHDLNKGAHGVRSPVDGNTVRRIGDPLIQKEMAYVPAFVQTV